MLYNVIYSRTFYIFLCVTWLCDSDSDICDNPAQFFSNFFKYSFSNFLSSYLNKILTMYLSSNLLLLNSSAFGFIFSFHNLSTSSYCLTSALILPSNLSTAFLTFSKFFSFSYISFSAVNLFQHTKYFITLLTFLLFKIFFTSHSFTLSTSTSFGSSTLYPFTSSLYLTILLMFTTR